MTNLDERVLRDAGERALEVRARSARTKAYYWDAGLWAKDMLDIDLWSKQKEIVADLKVSKNIAVKAGHGVGKVVSYTETIWTPSGHVAAGTLHVGDTVFDEAGRETTITGLSPVWERPEYRVTFDDGATVLCGPEHEWSVLDLTKRSSSNGTKSGVGDWREYWHTAHTYETQELLEAGLKTSSNQARWRIPLTRPLERPEAALPIDPYLLGFWLGDGSKSSGQITIGLTKRPLLDWLDSRGYEYSLRDEWDKGRAIVTPKLLIKDLRALGVLDNKHIPMMYLQASEAQRRALLAGLMDADGFLLRASGGAAVGIDMTHRRLSEDIYALLMTLGCKVRWSEGEAAYTLDGMRHVVGTRYRMNWTPLENPFKIRGQGWSGDSAQRSRHTQRTIVSIEATGQMLKNFCIEVDSPRHLYLAGKSLVPTHNSLLAAALVCWWVDTRYPAVFAATTAPSVSQVGSILWREIRRMYSDIEKRYKAGIIDHKLPGKINTDNRNNEWKDDNGALLAFGRKPPEEDADSAFQGIHDAAVLAVGDEAVGLPLELIDALGNITSNDNSRRLLIANPTNPASYFGKLFKEHPQGWSFHTISVFDSPNFTEEGKKMRPEVLEKLTGPSYVKDKKAEYGENSARYKARVLGEFAFDLGDTLIQPDDLIVADDCELIPSSETTPRLGVDIAAMGVDKSVIYSYHDGQLRFVTSWDKADAVESARRIIETANGLGCKEVRIDAGGFGGAVADIVLNDEQCLFTVVKMWGSKPSPDKHQWFNARAFWWDRFRSLCRQDKMDIDPLDETLHDELMSVEYKTNTSTGGIQIESKDDMRKRGFKSPDYADAAIYAAAELDEVLNDPLATRVGEKVYEDMEQFEIGWMNLLPW